MHEELWRVHLSDQILHVTNPHGDTKQMPLAEIRGIAIQTNDSGPVGSDVIWVVSNGELTIRFPMGAAGEREILGVFQKIEGFNHMELINAMSSVDNTVFIVLDKRKV